MSLQFCVQTDLMQFCRDCFASGRYLMHRCRSRFAFKPASCNFVVTVLHRVATSCKHVAPVLRLNRPLAILSRLFCIGELLVQFCPYQKQKCASLTQGCRSIFASRPTSRNFAVSKNKSGPIWAILPSRKTKNGPTCAILPRHFPLKEDTTHFCRERLTSGSCWCSFTLHKNKTGSTSCKTRPPFCKAPAVFATAASPTR